MDCQKSLMSRRVGMIRGTQLLVGAAVIVMVGQSARAAKADKGDFFYQDKPKDGKSCSTCRLYLTGADGKGECAIVDGTVSPNGWCAAYSPRT